MRECTSRVLLDMFSRTTESEQEAGRSGSGSGYDCRVHLLCRTFLVNVDDLDLGVPISMYLFLLPGWQRALYTTIYLFPVGLGQSPIAT